MPGDHGAARHCRPACHHRFLRRPGTPGLGITQDGHIAGAGTRQHVAGAAATTCTCAREVAAALRSLGAVRPDLEPKAAADVLWLLIDPSQYRRLVTERRWTHRAFQHWQADAMTRCCSPEPGITAGARHRSQTGREFATQAMNAPARGIPEVCLSLGGAVSWTRPTDCRPPRSAEIIDVLNSHRSLRVKASSARPPSSV